MFDFNQAKHKMFLCICHTFRNKEQIYHLSMKIDNSFHTFIFFFFFFAVLCNFTYGLDYYHFTHSELINWWKKVANSEKNFEFCCIEIKQTVKELRQIFVRKIKKNRQ